MDERILKWLYDIDFAIKEIDSYFEGVEKDFSAYSKNTMLKRAIERDLEIIGEAVNRILNRDASFVSKYQMQNLL
ncbi:HepT-like ribonuclease domain-containing protein [Mariniflexile soesokkakense]|uniref:HepT-like ribonuclease domain-containing protein n=1 Tax=Mariniflexile soesokkakense TaxID=1343160 RepID=A0ABV0AAX1_9FLAO